MSDSESEILELVDGARVHDIEIVLSGWEVFRDLDSCDLIIYDLKLRVLEDQVIAELDRYDLVETVTLDDDEPILVVRDGFRSDVRDIDKGIRVFECQMDIRGQYLAVLEREEYEIFSAREYIVVYLDEKSAACVHGMDALFSDVHELDVIE